MDGVPTPRWCEEAGRRGGEEARRGHRACALASAHILTLDLARAAALAGDGGVQEVSWETVVAELQDELVHYGNSLGFGGGNFSCGAFSQMMVVSLKCQAGAARSGMPSCGRCGMFCHHVSDF